MNASQNGHYPQTLSKSQRADVDTLERMLKTTDARPTNENGRVPSKRGRSYRIIPSPKYLKQLTSGGKGPAYLLEPFVPRESVVLIVGESSVGKTYFFHSVGYALATGTEILGLAPSGLLRVLHVDFESPGAVTRRLLRSVGTEERWHFARVDGKKQLLRMLKTVGHHYDVIILDSLMVASPVNDENSNAEANRQMLPFLKLARKTKAAILLSHNSGEGNPKEKFKSRGATARVDRPDLVLNLDDLGDGKRRLKIVKSRFGTLGQTLEFEIDRSKGFGYRVLKPVTQPKTKQQRMERRVIAACKKYRTRSLSRGQIAQVIRLDLKNDSKMKLFDRTLKTLTKRRALEHAVRGRYQLAGTTA